MVCEALRCVRSTPPEAGGEERRAMDKKKAKRLRGEDLSTSKTAESCCGRLARRVKAWGCRGGRRSRPGPLTDGPEDRCLALEQKKAGTRFKFPPFFQKYSFSIQILHTHFFWLFFSLKSVLSNRLLSNTTQIDPHQGPASFEPMQTQPFSLVNLL